MEIPITKEWGLRIKAPPPLKRDVLRKGEIYFHFVDFRICIQNECHQNQELFVSTFGFFNYKFDGTQYCDKSRFPVAKDAVRCFGARPPPRYARGRLLHIPGCNCGQWRNGNGNGTEL